jgi:hypothetical protein
VRAVGSHASKANADDSERGLGVLREAQLVVFGGGEKVTKVDIGCRRTLVAQSDTSGSVSRSAPMAGCWEPWPG